MHIRYRFLYAFSVLLSLLAFSKPTFAQNTSNEGTDFWVAYAGHVDGTNSRLTLFITAKVAASVNITVGGVPYACQSSGTGLHQS